MALNVVVRSAEDYLKEVNGPDHPYISRAEFHEKWVWRQDAVRVFIIGCILCSIFGVVIGWCLCEVIK